MSEQKPFRISDKMLKQVRHDASGHGNVISGQVANSIIVSLVDEVKALRAELAESQRHEAQWKEMAQRNERYAEENFARFEELENAGVDFLQFVEQHGTRAIAKPLAERELFRHVTRLADAIRRPIQLTNTHD